MGKEDLYDVVVLGGGTAGSNGARSAVQAGAKKVLLVHSPRLLNTCVEEGCMPSKSIIHAAAEGASLAEATENMDAHIDRLLNSLSDMLSREAFKILVGDARFLPDEQGLEIVTKEGKQTVKGTRYVIATGSSPFIPPIEGIDTLPKDSVLTSEAVVSHRHIASLPQSLFILGGGPIGLEMMMVFKDFNVPVTIAERGPHLLSRMDPEFGLELEKALKLEKNVTLLTQTEVTRVRAENNKVIVETREAGKITEHCVERLLVATGRRPNLEGLELLNAGVVVEEGKPKFDPNTLITSNPNIYIAGDATGTYQILHYASAMGKVAGHNAAVGKSEQQMRYEELNMGIIFSEPQVGNVGLSERAAQEKGIDTVSSVLDLPNIGRGLLEEQPVGLWKLTVQKSDARIIGAQAVSPTPHSEWFVDTVAWLMYFKATAYDLRNKEPYYHPTYPELLQSMGRELCRKLGKEEDDTICPN